MSGAKPRKLVTLSSDSARRVEDFRFGHRIGSESEASCRLIHIGLDQIDQGQPRPEAIEPSSDASQGGRQTAQ